MDVQYWFASGISLVQNCLQTVLLKALLIPGAVQYQSLVSLASSKYMFRTFLFFWFYHCLNLTYLHKQVLSVPSGDLHSSPPAFSSLTARKTTDISEAKQSSDFCTLNLFWFVSAVSIGLVFMRPAFLPVVKINPQVLFKSFHQLLSPKCSGINILAWLFLKCNLLFKSEKGKLTMYNYFIFVQALIILYLDLQIAQGYVSLSHMAAAQPKSFLVTRGTPFLTQPGKGNLGADCGS